jgi:hypothetical protein
MREFVIRKRHKLDIHQLLSENSTAFLNQMTLEAAARQFTRIVIYDYQLGRQDRLRGQTFQKGIEVLLFVSCSDRNRYSQTIAPMVRQQFNVSFFL